MSRPPAVRCTPVFQWGQEPGDKARLAGISSVFYVLAMNLFFERHRRAWTHETAEDALVFFSRLFDEAPAAMVVAQPNFLVTDANIAAQQLFQRPLSTLKGKPFEHNVAEQDLAAFSAIQREIIDTPGRHTRPLLIRTGDDRNVEVSMIAAAFRDRNDKPEYVMLILLERGENISSDIL